MERKPSFLKILNFNFDLLSLECLTEMGPVRQFTLRVCTMPMIIFASALVHFGRLDLKVS